LGRIGRDAGQAVGALVGALADPERPVSLAAEEALGELGPQAVGPLIGALADPDEQVRNGAAVALGRSGQDAVPAAGALVAALADPGVRQEAKWALEMIGPGSVEPLRQALAHPDRDVRDAAADLLRRLQPGKG